MQTLHNRRDFLASASLAGVASLLGRGESFAQEAPPETTTVRIPTGTLICNAPTYIADELLRAEGFTDIQRVPVPPDRLPMEGELDFAMVYTRPWLRQSRPGRLRRCSPECMSDAIRFLRTKASALFGI
jgi:NitT/TauT family transport system substrate-binding protein